MFRGYLKQSTQVTKTVLMIDSADHITGKTGLAAGITKYLSKVGTASSATMTTAEVDATNVKGVYTLVFTTSHTDTLGGFQLHLTASGADPSDDWWEVVTYLPGEAVTLQADQAVNASKIGGTTQTGRDIGASVLLSSGSGTGQLDFASGVVKSNLAQILGTALTETAGLLAGGFKKFFNVATPTGTLNSIPDAVPNAAGGLPTTSEVNAQMDTALVDINLDHLVKAAVDTDFGTTVHDNSVIGYIVAISDTAAFNRTLASLEAFESNALTVAQIRGGVAVKSGAVATDGTNSATTFKTDLVETNNDQWKDAFLTITSGVLAGQTRKITGYDGTTKFITLSALTATPADAVTFTIVNV